MPSNNAIRFLPNHASSMLTVFIDAGHRMRGPEARCYAGVGVVRDSDPTAELAETEVKLEALLPVLAG